MEDSKKGVILVSFGSIAKSHLMPQKLKNIFFKTFKEFPDITFVLQYENNEEGLLKDLKNVVISEWIPQADMLSKE